MSFDAIVADDYGQIMQLTFIDVDTGSAADISGYSTSQVMIFRRPDGTEVSKTAAFTTDGSDGAIQYTVEEDFLTNGQWRVRGRVTRSNAQLTTEWHLFKVLD